MVGLFHASCGVLALVLGAQLFLARKGTRTHVWVGRAYVASTLCLDLSSFTIYNLSGGLNTFHMLAVISLATVLVGLIQVVYRRRLRNWLWRHYQYMSWSYVGLLAATSNEAFVRVPLLRRLTANTTPWLPLAALLTTLIVSVATISWRQKRLLERYGGGA